MSTQNLKTPSLDESTRSEDISSVSKNFVQLLPVVIIVSIAVCIVLLASLLSYYLVRTAEFNKGKESFETVADSATTSLEGQISATTNSVFYLRAYLQNADPLHMDQDLQYVPFTYATGSFPDFITGLILLLAIPDSKVNETVTLIRQTFGPYYVNFTLTARNASNNAVIPIPPGIAMHYPITRLSPWTETGRSGLGFDNGSSPSRLVVIEKAIATRSLASTGLLTFSIAGNTTLGCNIYLPVYNYTNTSQVTGVVAASIETSLMIASAASTLLTFSDISVVDINGTDLASGFIYNTLNPSMTGQQNLKSIANAIYTTVRYIPFADRTWMVTFIPNSAYLNSAYTIDQYIGVIVSVIVFVIIVGFAIVLFFVMKLANIVQLRKKGIRQIGLLKEHQSGLKSLLEKITQQEQKTRALIDCLPDHIMVIGNNGMIINTNASFDETYLYSNEALSKGLFIGTVFPQTEFGFFKKMSTSDVVETDGLTQTEVRIPVQLRVRKLQARSEGDFGAENTSDDTEAYVVIAHVPKM